MNSDFSVSLNRDELFALEKLVTRIATVDASEVRAVHALSTDTTRCLIGPLDAACTRMRAEAAPESCSISLTLEPWQADSLANWMGRLTVHQIESVVVDPDTADAASLAIWNLMGVLRPVSLYF